MEERLGNLYRKLGRQILAMIPVKWTAVHYLGEVEPERASWSSVFYFQSADSGEWVQSNSMPKLLGVPEGEYMSAWMRLNGILLEIYDCFAENGQAPWEQLTFSIDADLKFKIRFGYDVMGPGDGGQLAREVLWAHRTFGYEPKDGAERKILDERRHSETT